MNSKPRYRVGVDGSNARIVPSGVPALIEQRPTQSSEYMRGPQGSTFFFNWNPSLRDSRDDVRSGYMEAAARTIDAIQNSGWLAGAVDQAIASTMGNELRLASKPDFEALGWDRPRADAWAKVVEGRWAAWAAEPRLCDAAGKQTMHQLASGVLASYFSHGEAVGLLPVVARDRQRRTRVKLMPAHKLTQDADGFRKFQGVTMDQWGMPLAYDLKMRAFQTWEETVTVGASDRSGHRQVLHIFDGKPEDVRGITPFAPALRVVKQYDNLSDNVLQSELLRAIFAATIKSDAPTQDVLRGLQDEDEQGVGAGTVTDLLTAKAGWYQNTKIDLGRSGRVAHLFPGEELNFHGSEGHASNYEAFAKFLLREIARCLGMTFETLTGDYTGATYSSVRMATSEIWPLVMRRRKNIPARFYQSVFELWLFEEIALGLIPFPGGVEAFLNLKAAACNADWRGGAKPQADDLKTAKAHEVYKNLGVITDEHICADLGHDWEDVYEQRAREMEKRKSLGLPEHETMAPDPAAEALLADDPPAPKPTSKKKAA